tara:strand:+ start:492 stop:1283 length:792 start_codon:yes stop_codon:yes gene_type:complete
MTGANKTVLITGSNRGIGLEFVRQYSDASFNVIATCRRPTEAENLQRLSKERENISIQSLDITNEKSINALHSMLENKSIDILINNAAFLGPPESQKFGEIDYEIFKRSFEVNAIGPIRITEKLIENVRKGTDKKVIFMGSAAGSISTITPPVTLYSYRSSKAALHLAVHNLFHQLKEENILVSLINPGLVDTRGFLDLNLDEPIPKKFTSMVPKTFFQMLRDGRYKMITTHESVGKMIRYIDDLSLESESFFVNNDGTPMPW